MNQASNLKSEIQEYCTFENNETYFRQIWYNCYTCDFVQGEGVCEVCAEKCHRNHELSEAKFSNFFCDCGAHKVGCKALPPDEDKPLVRNGMCTYDIQTEPFIQHWYHCHTCQLEGSFGVCSECANMCHKDHNITYAQYSPFFCDCGSSSSGSCKAMIEDESDLAKKLCTYTVTKKEYSKQHWFYCRTCNLVEETGVCLICAKTCHKNHDLVYSKYSNFYCDCGALASFCKALKPRSQASNVTIQELEDSDEDDELDFQIVPDFKAMSHYKKALEMGLDEDLIKHVINLKWEETGDPDMDVTDLVDAVLSLKVEDKAAAVVEEEPTWSKAGSKFNVLAEDQNAKEIRELKESKQCKICLDAELEVMFMPCGHLIACRRCADYISECALCRKKIDQKVRAYFS